MYIPPAFAENDSRTLHDFIEQFSFGLLVSQIDSVPFATHLPFLLDRDSGPRGTLFAHVARSNPHWRHFASGNAVQGLAVFSGAHAYISPAWYEASPVVPTWNYAAVHATGPVETIEDRDRLLDLVTRFVIHYESNRPVPWQFDPTSEFAGRLADQIVGLVLRIERLEGKWKMGQNQPVERRQKAIRNLETLGDEQSVAVAELMRAALPPP